MTNKLLKNRMYKNHYNERLYIIKDLIFFNVQYYDVYKYKDGDVKYSHYKTFLRNFKEL